MLGNLLRAERIAQNISQAALAKGICSVSYLSKIENNRVKASDDIIKLLFDVLDIDFTVDIDEFKVMFDTYVDNIYHFIPNVPINSKMLKKFFYSPMAIQARLIDAYQKEDIDALNILQAKGDLKVIHEILRCSVSYKTTNNLELLHALESIEHLDQSGYVLYLKAFIHYINGHYLDVIRNGEKSYLMFAKNGNVLGMMNCANHIATAYSNLDHMKSSLDYYRIVQNIARLLPNNNRLNLTHYNIGATYLSNGYYDLAIDYLLKAKKGNSEIIFDVLSKLVIAYALNNDFKNAKTIFNQIELSTDELEVLIYKSLDIMVHENNFMSSRDLSSALEKVVENSQLHSHYGTSRFFALLLYQVYQIQKRYKLALDIYRKYKIKFTIS